MDETRTTSKVKTAGPFLGSQKSMLASGCVAAVTAVLPAQTLG